MRADAEKASAEFIYQTKFADQKRAELDAEILEKRIRVSRTHAEAHRHFFLTAPTDGVVTEGTAKEGEVIDAHTAIFSLFNPNEYLCCCFFAPSDVGHLARGQVFQLEHWRPRPTGDGYADRLLPRAVGSAE